jgi:hypothetical protein
MPEKVDRQSPRVMRLTVKYQMRFSDSRKKQTCISKTNCSVVFLQYKTQHPNNPDCEKALL